MQFFRWPKFDLVVLRQLASLSTLLDSASPRVRRKYRRIVFRLFGGLTVGALYRNFAGTPKLHAILGGFLAAALCRVKVYGVGNLPKGGFLLAPNHCCSFDAVLLQLACPRPIRFIMHETVYHHRWVSSALRILGAEAIPISSAHAKQAIRDAADRIRAGEVVCIFPEGGVSHTGGLLKLRGGFELVARFAQCEIVPVWVDGLHGSIFSFKAGRYFLKIPKRAPVRVSIAFGKPMPACAADRGAVWQQLGELSEFCFRHRPELDGHLSRLLVRALKRHPFGKAIIDGKEGREIKRSDLLATSIALSRWIKKQCPGERVGVVLPSGSESVLANIAITLANKVPATFDSTMTLDAIQMAMSRNSVLCAISAEKIGNQPGRMTHPKNVYFLKEMLSALALEIAFWRIVSLIAPAWMLSGLLQLPKLGNRKEALIFFESHAQREVRGTVLSHRNLLGTIIQLTSMLNRGSDGNLMALLPPTKGWCYSIYYLLAEAVQVIGYPTPADAETSAGPGSRGLGNVRLFMTLDDRRPPKLLARLKQEFESRVFEGYACSEGGVISLNLPNPHVVHPSENVQPAMRDGSVGKLLPGQAAQIRDTDTGELLSPHKRGILWLKGANIFERYLNEPEETRKVLRDGWFQTGQLAQFDEDGFLFVDGYHPRTGNNSDRYR